MAKITKEYIIELLSKHYQETGKTPRSKDISVNVKTVASRFGSWNDALIAAGLQVNKEPPQQVNCETCGTPFMKHICEIRKSNNHFCSQSCSATYNNQRRERTEEYKEKVRDSLSKYRSENKIIRNCIECGAVNNRYSSDYCSKQCYKQSRPSTCIICNISFKGSRKTCSDECLKTSMTRTGHKSQQSQPHRSKGESLFFDLCVQYFRDTEVLSNPQMFIDNNGNAWDCDIVIPKYKVCIAYNGIYHYEDLRGTHKLKQVQSRDKIKKTVIFDNQFIQYIVKDLGRFNAEFVHREFHKFIFSAFVHFELLSSFDEF